MKKILTVCVGNICRSPMAEGLLSAALPNSSVESAGIQAVVGSPADEMAVDLMKAKGVDISCHVARQISRSMCIGADLILAMDVFQCKHIEALYPETKGKVFRLGQFLGVDIPDPYRMSREFFEETSRLIDAGVGDWLARIRRI